MKHRASSTHRMDARGRHNGQTNKQAENKRTCLFVRLFVYLCLIRSLTRRNTGNESSARSTGTLTLQQRRSDEYRIFVHRTDRNAISLGNDLRSACVGEKGRPALLTRGRRSVAGRTKSSWTKTTHHTNFGLVFGYGLSNGPTEGLGSWWPSDLPSPLPTPDSHASTNSYHTSHNHCFYSVHF